MSDLISRQAAIDVFKSLIDIGGIFTNDPIVGGALIAVKETIAQLPAAQPEPKRGRWIEDADVYYKAVNEKGGGANENTPFFTEDYVACSECLALFNVLENRTDIFSFCPNCGAKMEGKVADE